tara:strand:- start:91 stop:360 length:270 start_codon:yes stop_codon:yes gene_type:complete
MYRVWSANLKKKKPLWLMMTFFTKEEAIDYAERHCMDHGAQKISMQRIMFCYGNLAEQEAVLVSDDDCHIGAIIEGLVIVEDSDERDVD